MGVDHDVFAHFDPHISLDFKRKRDCRLGINVAPFGTGGGLAKLSDYRYVATARCDGDLCHIYP